jgi:hypothetical protein
MPTSASDQELLARQEALQAEATQVLAELDLDRLFGDVGPVLVVGSYLSGLMCWRDLDVGVLAGVDCSPSDVLELLKRVVELPGLVGFSYRDEPGGAMLYRRGQGRALPRALRPGRRAGALSHRPVGVAARPARPRRRLACAAARHHHG